VDEAERWRHVRLNSVMATTKAAVYLAIKHIFLIGLSLSAGRSVKAHPPLIVHADAVLSMSTRQGGQGQDMPSKGARCQSLEATIPCDELAVCQNGETKVAPVVDRAVKL